MLKLEEKDYLERDSLFWKEYREYLYENIKYQEQEEKLEKTPENIVRLAKERGIKPTARYFNIQPTQVRYYIKKLSNVDK